MLKDRRNNFFLTFLFGLIFALVPVSFVQAATGSAAVELNDSVISMENIAGKPSVIVTNLPEGAIVKVYDQNSGGKLLGNVTVKTGQISAIVSIPNLNKDVYVSVTLESVRTLIAVPATGSLEDNPIIVVNNAGIADTVTVKDLATGDIVKVYKAEAEGGKLLGTATVAKDKTEAVVSIPQLGINAGEVEVTLTSIGRKESERFVKNYLEELQTDTLENRFIIVVNNTGIADTVTVKDLAVGDIVKVYKAGEGGKLLGTASVAKGKTEAVVSIPKLPTPEETFDITLTSIGKTESERFNISSYDEEPSTDDLAADCITVINNAGIADTVTVVELQTGDIVKVYEEVEGGKLLGTATVAKSKTEAVVSIPKLPSNLNIYVTLTSIGKTESSRCLKSYDEEPKTYALENHNITIVNNAGLADTVKVTDGDVSILEVGDIIKVYDAETAGKLLGNATVVKGKTETAAVVSIRQLGATSGSVWVTVTSKGKLESDRCERMYDAEAQTKVDTIVIVVDNYLGKNDTVKVTGLGLVVGDIIKVYNAETAGKLLGNATVVKGKTETAAVVSIRQLSAASGSAWVTVTSKGKLESIRVEKVYGAEGAVVPTAKVSVLAFTDTDTDANQMGGTLTWTAPEDVSNVTHYVVYASANGTTKGAQIEAAVAVGTNQLVIPANTALAAYIIVVTKNAVGEAIAANYVSVAVADGTVAPVAATAIVVNATSGTAVGDTNVSAVAGDAGTLKYSISNASVEAPVEGLAEPGGLLAFTAGDMTIAADDYIHIYEIKGGVVTGYGEHKVVVGEIK